MRRTWIWALSAMPACALAAAACTGDDDIFRAAPANDGGPFDTGAGAETGGPASPNDSGKPGLGCGDAAGAPQRALVVYATGPSSELAAVNLATSTVDGRLKFASGDPIVTPAGTDPYLFSRDKDTVTRLDAREPWKTVASWNVHGDDAPPGDAGLLASANPVAIAIPGCGKAYVLRYNRNRLAIVDTSEPTDAGVPTGYVDLSSLVGAGDKDHLVEMSSAVYVPSKKRVYVLLGNIDLTKIYKPTPTSFTQLLCSSATAPSVVAIDVETDQLVSLGGSAPGGGIALRGYNPTQAYMFYDAALDRLLVLHAGCNEDVDGGPGAMARRGIEEVSLASGQTKELVSLNDKGYPSSFAFVDGKHAAISFYDGTAYFWDPTQTTLGPAIGQGLDLLSSTGKDAVVGVHQVYDQSFDPGPLQLVVAPFDGGSTVVLENPQSAEAGTGYAASVEAWPKP